MAKKLYKPSHIVENIIINTTIHGVPFVAKPKLHLSERILWVVVVCVALGGAISVVHSNLMRYRANPTVVSLQKDFRNWLNAFPASTGCFKNKIDAKKAEKFIEQTWGINPTNVNYYYYYDFVTAVANISYHNLHEFNKFKNDAILNSVNMIDIAGSVHPRLSGTLVTFDTKRKTNWQLILTEVGICFSMNAKFSKLLSYRLSDDLTKKEEYDDTILRCHYLNGLCYARYDSDPQLSLNYYIHSYLDVVHATSEAPLELIESEELEINYRMQETLSSPELKNLSPSQRRCRFDDEPIIDELPVYSTSMCYIGCRYKLALKLCGCKPFFYHFLEGKVCDIDGLICLANYARNITSSPSHIGCHCPQQCNVITYLRQKPKLTKWEHGYFDQRITFRWGLVPPTTRYHRDIIFGLENLAVSVGGTVALFLGMSTTSIIEIIFLIVESIYHWINNYPKKDEKKKPATMRPTRQPIKVNPLMEKGYNQRNYQKVYYRNYMNSINSQSYGKQY